jgi:hypothetical protein
MWYSPNMIVREDEMDGECSAHGGDEKLMQNLFTTPEW